MLFPAWRRIHDNLVIAVDRWAADDFAAVFNAKALVMSQASRKDRLKTLVVPGLLPEGGTEQSNARPSQRSARLEVANASMATGPPNECAQRANF